MSQYILSDTDFNQYLKNVYQDEQIKYLSEKLNELDKGEQMFIYEFISSLSPNKMKPLNESKWYNILGDIVGFFDPTGIVDLVNGISYFKQGDTLFGILSFISVLPGFDFVTKPVIGLMKGGSRVGKLFKGAVVAGDAAKMGKIAGKSRILSKLVETVSSWGSKLKGLIPRFLSRGSKVSRGVTNKLSSTIDLFTNARKSGKTISRVPDALSRTHRVEKNVEAVNDSGDPFSSTVNSLFH